MVWNQPSDNGQDRDPWGSNNTGNSENNKDKRQKAESTPKIFLLLQKKLKRWFNFGKRGPGSRKSPRVIGTRTLLLPIFVVLLGGWFGMGLYSLQQGDTAVITRFGQVKTHINTDGMHWYPKFIDQLYIVNTAKSSQVNDSSMLLTADSNLIQFSATLDYKITQPAAYLFNVSDPTETLQELLESDARDLIVKSTMQTLLTGSKTSLAQQLQSAITASLTPYNLGITIGGVTINELKEPSQLDSVSQTLDKAKKTAQQTVTQSEQTATHIVAEAKLQAQKMVADAKLFQEKSVEETQAQIQQLTQILPVYQSDPNLVKAKLYFDAMQRVLSKNNKVLFDGNGKQLMVLPVGEQQQEATQPPKKDTTTQPETSSASNNQTKTSTTASSDVTATQVSSATNRTSNNESSIFAQRAKNVKRLTKAAREE